MSTTLKYLSAFGIVLALVLTLGVATSRAVDSQNFGAVVVSRDVAPLTPPYPNEFGDDWATNSATGMLDADMSTHPMPPYSYGLGACGSMTPKCRRGH